MHVLVNIFSRHFNTYACPSKNFRVIMVNYFWGSVFLVILIWNFNALDLSEEHIALIFRAEE